MLPSTLEPKRVLEYFAEISAIPRGSLNMKGISDYCINFAENHSLKAIRDKDNNVIIFKDASKGYENSEPIILQGHLDIVCQKSEDCDIDFLKDGLKIYSDGDFIKAEGTTLGADNGIAIAMILAILESNDISHPPIEAVFTTDEEIGMFGAIGLDASSLRGKRMINLDSEEDDTLFVSCAGGRECKITIPVKRIAATGTEITINIKGLKGGHSGVEIDKGRVNASVLAGRFLNYMNNRADFNIISIEGGDKSNAITNSCKICLCTSKPENFISIAENCCEIIKNEIAEREPSFSAIIKSELEGEFSVISDELKDKLIFSLLCVPYGVMEMSAEIEGLVETSLNLGILKTEHENVILNISLRSNKSSALDFLEEKLKTFFSVIPCSIESFGHYPPWEYKADSKLRELYKVIYTEQFGFQPKITAIHAGLECGIFSSKIEGLDCIAIGPNLFDVHTVDERLSISSTEQIFKLLLKILEKCK